MFSRRDRDREQKVFPTGTGTMGALAPAQSSALLSERAERFEP